MTEIKAGDRVRVVLEGVVSTPYPSGGTPFAQAFFIGTGNGKSVGVVYDDTLATEIHVEKRKPQAGDVIPKYSKASVYDALPVGTVLEIVDGPREQIFLKSSTGWTYSATGQHYPVESMLCARRVVYIP